VFNCTKYINVELRNNSYIPNYNQLIERTIYNIGINGITENNLSRFSKNVCFFMTRPIADPLFEQFGDMTNCIWGFHHFVNTTESEITNNIMKCCSLEE